jgi:CBS domain-containing protein
VRLGELLDARRVVVPLKARSVRDATRQLAKTLAQSGAVRDEGRLTELLKTEWPEDILHVAGRAFLPHFRTDAASAVAVALGVTPEPICLQADPARCARVIVLILAPTAESSSYLRAMSAVATALSGDETLAALLAAKKPEDVLTIPAIAEAPVPPDVTVADVMSTAVTSVGQDASLREASDIMLARRVRAVPVTGANGEVLGELSDGHLLRYLLPQTVSQLSTGQYRAAKRPLKGAKIPAGVDPQDLKVKDVMDRSVLCLSEDQTIADVAALMLVKAIDRFPVTRDGALVGFLTRGDIVRKLLGT